MNEEFANDVWLSLKEYFDKKQIDIIASTYISTLIDNGVDDDTLKNMLGSDEDLDDAINMHTSEEFDELIEDDEFFDDEI